MTKVVPAVTEEVKDALVKNIRRRMTPQPMKIRADIELKCFQFDGVIHIKVVTIIGLSITYEKNTLLFHLIFSHMLAFSGSHEKG